MKGHVQVLLQLRPDQHQALLALADARREPGRRPPVSEVARELIDQVLGSGSSNASVKKSPAKVSPRGDRRGTGSRG